MAQNDGCVKIALALCAALPYGYDAYDVSHTASEIIARLRVDAHQHGVFLADEYFHPLCVV